VAVAAQTLARRLVAVGPATLLALVAMALAATLLIALTGPLTFILDDWAFLVYRRGFDAQAILEPHNEHIVIGPVLAYKALLELFGMDSPRPFQLLAIATFLTSAALLYTYVRARVGAWLALAAILIALFLGPAWENLLWPFQLGMLASMASGLGMLLALERRDSFGDRLAAALLAISLLFSSLGLAFAAGAAVSVALDSRRLQRAWIVAGPALAFAIWWLGWGHHADSVITADNLVGAPGYVFDGFAASVQSALGLVLRYDGLDPEPLMLGRPVLVVLLILAALRLRRLGSVPRGLLVVGAVALAFWGLAALNAMEARPPTNSRYQFVGVFLLLAISAELMRGWRPPKPMLAAIVALAALIAGWNALYLRDAQRTLADTSELVRADLGAVEIARDTVDPNMALSADIAGTIAVGIPVGPYLSAADAFGTPAATPAEIEGAAPAAREAADKVLMRALRLTFTPVERPARPRGCEPIRLDGPVNDAAATVPTGGAVVVAGQGERATFRLRRFAEGFPIEVGSLRGGEAAELMIPADRAPQPWELVLAGGTTAQVCEPTT
jgi:hypothetical protein